MQESLTLDTPIDEVIGRIAAEGALATLAVALCQVRFAESAPRFRAVLERAAEGDCEGEEAENLFFVGLHVLGAGRDKLSFPALLRLIRRPEEELERLLGDAETETLPAIATGMFDGDADALFDAMVDPGVGEHVRFGLFDVLAFHTWNGGIARERSIRFLERFHDERLAGDADLTWNQWAEAIALLGLRSLVPRVEHARRDGRLHPGFDDPKDWARRLARAEAEPENEDRFAELGIGYIEDVLVALERFSFDDEVFEDDLPLEDVALDPLVPARNEWRHVGRNDPCPCGSGKKFKKCCLNKER